MEKINNPKYRWLPVNISFIAVALILLFNLIREICTGFAGGTALFWIFLAGIILMMAYYLFREFKSVCEKKAALEETLAEKNCEIDRLAKKISEMMTTDALEPDQATPVKRKGETKTKTPVSTGLTYGDDTIIA